MTTNADNGEGVEPVAWLQMLYELRHPERERVGWQDNADVMRAAADEIERLCALSRPLPDAGGGEDQGSSATPIPICASADGAGQ